MVIRLDAIVHDIERPVMAALAAQLSTSLSAADKGVWEAQIRLRAPPLSVDPDDPPLAIIASLLPELATPDEPVARVEARWREALAALGENMLPNVFVCTMFRVVAGARQDPGDISKIAERIRRLNLLAVDLSHDFGINIVDIDRAFAHVGARWLQSDFRLGSLAAEEVAAHTIAVSLMAAGFGNIALETLDEAKRVQGPLWELDKFVQRRIAERERLAGSRP
jgi:hypothetical protein